MIERELKEYKYIILQIKSLDEQIKSETFISSMKLSEKISSSKISNSTEEQAMKITKLKKDLKRKLNKLEISRDRIFMFIEKIEEPHFQMMVTFKYINSYDNFFIADYFDKSTRTIQRWHNQFKKKYLRK